MTSDGSFRYQIICNFCLKDKINIKNSKVISLNNGMELYGDFRTFNNIDELNKIVDIIVNSFYENKLPIQGEYNTVIDELNFVKDISL